MSTRISGRTISLGLGFATGVIIAYMFLVLREIVFPKDPLFVLAAILTYLFGWLVSAIRLKYLHRLLDGNDKPLKIHHYFKARILGGLLAYVTPSALGGEPARAYYLTIKTNGYFSRFFAITLLEAYYDVVTVNIIALGLSIIYIPLSIPVILVASASIAYWVIFYYILKNLVDPDKLVYPLNHMVIYAINKIKGRISGYERFVEAFKYLTDKLTLMDKIFLAIYTFLYQLFFSIVAYFVFLSYNPGMVHNKMSSLIDVLFKSIIAYFYSNSLAALPTPGGAISAEYGLSIVLSPEVVILTRIILYYTPIILGLYIVHREKLLHKLTDLLNQKQ